MRPPTADPRYRQPLAVLGPIRRRSQIDPTQSQTPEESGQSTFKLSSGDRADLAPDDAVDDAPTRAGRRPMIRTGRRGLLKEAE
jgi:hypothetical protein